MIDLLKIYINVYIFNNRNKNTSVKFHFLKF